MGYSYKIGRNTAGGSGTVLSQADSSRIAFLWSNEGLGTNNIVLGSLAGGVVVKPTPDFGSFIAPYYCDYQGSIDREVRKGPIATPPGFTFIDIRDDICKPPYHEDYKFGCLGHRTITTVPDTSPKWQQIAPANRDRISLIITRGNTGIINSFYLPQPSGDPASVNGLYMGSTLCLILRYCQLGDIVREAVYLGSGFPNFQNVMHVTEVFITR